MKNVIVSATGCTLTAGKTPNWALKDSDLNTGSQIYRQAPILAGALIIRLRKRYKEDIAKRGEGFQRKTERQPSSGAVGRMRVQES